MAKLTMRAAVLAGALLALAACGEPTKQDILAKAENVSTKAELESALGRPDDISKLGPIEQWTYRGSDGEVVFVITGDSVALSATGGSGGK
jgi:hypothetical protein